MTQACVLMAQTGAVRTLTLNRPQALNSFTPAMLAELTAAVDVAAGDTATRCLVLTGAGRAFCAGQDLNDASLAPPDSDVAPAEGDAGDLIEHVYKPLALRLRAMPIPVIAAVNGVAAGAGANIALGCDLVIAAASASFIQAFSKIGLLPDVGGTWLLPRLVGRARALGLAFTGDKLPAAEAERIGLIWKCVDDAAFADEVAATSARLAAMPMKALAATRRAVDAAALLDFADALSMEGAAQRELARAGDFREGVAAFKERRVARFSDR